MARVLLVPIALALLLFPDAGLAQSEQGANPGPLTCASCGKPITGKYLQALGKNWHPEHFTCSRCRRSLAGERFSEAGGLAYCTTCFAELFNPRCASCGKPILDRCVTALGKSWHPEHFTCAACQRPLEGQVFVPHEGHLYCQSCYREKYDPRCGVCDRPLEGRYLEDYWGDRFCERHREELDKCFSCQRPICDRLTGGGVRYQDGRSMCNLCRRTAIDSVGQGARIALQVRQALSRMGFDLGGVEIPLRLVGLDELEGARRRAEPLNGKTRTLVQTQDGRELSRRVEEILVLHGLPQGHYAAVLAHEYGHAYLFLQHFPPLSPQVEEGFCQLLSYQWLGQQGTQEAGFFRQLTENSEDPVYGAGFRQAAKSLGSRSIAELAEYLRQHRRFPPP